MTPKENIIINGGLMTEYQYTVFFEPAEEGGYNVVVPAIPEICTFGNTLENARTMAADAIRCVIESNLKSGEELPEDVKIDTKPVVERVAVNLVA